MAALRPLLPRTVVERRARSLPCRVLVLRVVPVRQGTRRQPFGRSVLPRQLRSTPGNSLEASSEETQAETKRMPERKGGPINAAMVSRPNLRANRQPFPSLEPYNLDRIFHRQILRPTVS